MITTIKIRRDYSATWTERNPVLADGEPGYEYDTRKIKIGNGFDPWSELDYVGSVPDDVPATSAELLSHINAAEPHPIYDDGPSLTLLYENAKV